MSASTEDQQCLDRPVAVEVEQLAAALDGNPVFHMSLGSKELFHSNFLWWLARAHPETARAVFGPWTEEDPAQAVNRVTREGSNLDVVFELSGYAPSAEQPRKTGLKQGVPECSGDALRAVGSDGPGRA